MLQPFIINDFVMYQCIVRCFTSMLLIRVKLQQSTLFFSLPIGRIFQTKANGRNETDAADGRGGEDDA